MARNRLGNNIIPCEARVDGQTVPVKDNRSFSRALCSLWGQLDNTDLKRNLRGKNRHKNHFNCFQLSQRYLLPIYQKPHFAPLSTLLELWPMIPDGSAFPSRFQYHLQRVNVDWKWKQKELRLLGRPPLPPPPSAPRRSEAQKPAWRSLTGVSPRNANNIQKTESGFQWKNGVWGGLPPWCAHESVSCILKRPLLVKAYLK